MGPPPFDGGNPQILHLTVDSRNELQWGHRLSTVETSSSSQSNVKVCDASMGPPPFDGGNRYLLLNSAFLLLICVIFAALVFTYGNRLRRPVSYHAVLGGSFARGAR